MPVCKLMVFDMDGTLTIPQTWMFREMRESINLPLDTKKDILVYLDREITDEKLRKQYHLNIKNIEEKAMRLQEPQPGMNEVFEFLNKNKISKSIVTRNLIDPVENFIEKFVDEKNKNFDIILTRDFKPPKPHPAPLLHIVKQLTGSRPEGISDFKEYFMVGDTYDDMKSGREAGFTTVLVLNEVNRVKVLEHEQNKLLVDHTVTKLIEIIDIIDLKHLGKET